MIDKLKNMLGGKPMPDTVALIGVPFDEYSSFMRGAAEAPPVIRQILKNGASNLFAENGVNLGNHPLFRDLGDLALPGGDDGIAATEKAAAWLTEKKCRILALGGDHAISYPVVKALTAVYDDLTILHLDAHPDLYDSYGGNRFSHACPFARIMETGRVKKLVQVGIRGMNDEQRRQVDRFGVTCIEMKDLARKDTLTLEEPVYLSLDLDVLDPAYAPGVSHHEPGGMSTRQVVALIQSVTGPIVGADIVEFNPLRDVNDMTAAVAAKMVKEIAGSMIARVR